MIVNNQTLLILLCCLSIFSILFLATEIVTKTILGVIVTSSFTFEQSKSSLYPYFDGIPDGRFRVARVQGTSVLGPLNMWLAFPTSYRIVPGTDWYESIWESHKLGGTQFIDEFISLSPCKSHDQIFLQVGAHLGIFPLLAAYRGCRGIAVEAMPLAVNFSRISAALNQWNSDQFEAINAAVGSKPDVSVWFDPGTISLSFDDTSTKGKVRVPMTTLDKLNERLTRGPNSFRRTTSISFIIIDVEGHEQEVLLGAEELIKQQTVLVFQIEVWTSSRSNGPVKKFRGLELLIRHGYRLYTPVVDIEKNIMVCEELTDKISQLPAILNETCQRSKLLVGDCLGEVLATRVDVIEPQRWSSICS